MAAARISRVTPSGLPSPQLIWHSPYVLALGMTSDALSHSQITILKLDQPEPHSTSWLELTLMTLVPAEEQLLLNCELPLKVILLAISWVHTAPPVLAPPP
jgi:hypothetical protein